MAFKTTEWEYSNETESGGYENPPEGPRYLYIEEAEFDRSDKKYTIYFRDVETDISFRVSMWMDRSDQDGSLRPNTPVRNTLITLGKALAGVPIGIPNTADIVGGVVVGEVVHYTATSGKVFPRIYKYSPAPEPIVLAYSTIDQYSEPGEL